MMNIILLVSLIFVSQIAAEPICGEVGYREYLDEFGQKCDLYPDDPCIPTFQGYALEDYVNSCDTFTYNQNKLAYDTHLTDLADWSTDGILKLQKTYLEYKHGASGYTLQDPKRPEGVLFHEEYRDCEAQVKRARSGAPTTEQIPSICHESHVYGAAQAFEVAYHRVTGSSIRVSVDFIKQCVFTARTTLCLGAHPYELLSIINEAGVVTREGWQAAQAEALLTSENPCVVAKNNHVVTTGFFSTAALMERNKAGLMDFFHEYVPLALMAINYDKLRYVDVMSQKTTNKEEYVTIRASYHDPTLFGVLTEYFDSTETREGFWKVASNVMPCMPVKLYLPIGKNHTNPSYAGIAGFVGGVQFTGFVPEEIAFHPYNITISMDTIVNGEESPAVKDTEPADYLKMINTAVDKAEAYRNTKFFAYFADDDTYGRVNSLLQDVADIITGIPGHTTIHDPPLVVYFSTPVNFYAFSVDENYLDGIEALITAVQPEEVFFDLMGIASHVDAFELLGRATESPNLRRVRIHNINSDFFTTNFTDNFSKFLTNYRYYLHLELLDLTSYDPAITPPPNVDEVYKNKPISIIFNSPSPQSDLCALYPDDLAIYCRFWWGH